MAAPAADFLVGAELWQRRLPHLSAAERQTLSTGLQEQLRHPWGHVWLTTEDGTLNGPIVIKNRGPGDVTA